VTTPRTRGGRKPRTSDLGEICRQYESLQLFLDRDVLRRTRLFSACHQNECLKGDPAVTFAGLTRKGKRVMERNRSPRRWVVFSNQ
jgi:hypothetical protein